MKAKLTRYPHNPILLPRPELEWDARGFIGRGCFHMNDIWFFAGNIATNAAERVSAWRDAKAPAGDAAEEKADDAPAAPAA